MRTKTLLAVLLVFAWASIPTPSMAQFGTSGMFFSNGIATTCSYTPPLDVQSGAAAAYGFRKLRTAYAGKAMNIQRASDNTTTDIGFTATCDFDVSAFTTFCNATTCSVKTWYDQSGNSVNATQATLANMPTITASCQNSKPCAVFVQASAQLLAGTLSSAVGAFSAAIVAERNTPIGQSILYMGIGNSTNGVDIATAASSPSITYVNRISGGAHQGTITSTNTTWYRIATIANNTLSRIYLNGTAGTDEATSLTLTASTTFQIGNLSTVTTAYMNGDISEIIVFAPDLSGAAVLSVSSNQGSYWGL